MLGGLVAVVSPVCSHLRPCSFPNPAKADTVHRRQAVCDQQAWAEEWCNGAVPQDDAACEAHIRVGRAGAGVGEVGGGWDGWGVGGVGRVCVPPRLVVFVCVGGWS